jgi:hypothetical protein
LQQGCTVDVKRVPETVPADVFAQSGGKANQPAPIATPAELANYDAIVFGTGTRFGNMTGQMRTFLDQTGGLWASGALVGKVGSVFTSSGTQHGGQESTILTFHPTLLHHGMAPGVCAVSLPLPLERAVACVPSPAAPAARSGAQAPAVAPRDCTGLRADPHRRPTTPLTSTTYICLPSPCTESMQISVPSRLQRG